jgi:hypothetical protein
MKLNDSISTYDVAEALQGETGKFEVTSPNGERYFVTCQPGHSIVSLEWAGSEPICNLSSCAKSLNQSRRRVAPRDLRLPSASGNPMNRPALIRPGF